MKSGKKNGKIKILFVATSSMFISSCALHSSQQAEMIIEIPFDRIEIVKGCELLGSVRGTSGWGGSGMSNIGIHNAKVSALEDAVKLGASHVVWVEAAGGMASFAKGQAYLCK